jgi:hypothetical protein
MCSRITKRPSSPLAERGGAVCPPPFFPHRPPALARRRCSTRAGCCCRCSPAAPRRGRRLPATHLRHYTAVSPALERHSARRREGARAGLQYYTAVSPALERGILHGAWARRREGAGGVGAQYPWPFPRGGKAGAACALDDPSRRLVRALYNLTYN